MEQLGLNTPGVRRRLPGGSLQQNWFSKHANMIMCNLFCKLLIGSWSIGSCHNFSDSCPAYFSDLLTVYTPSRQLRSSADTWILHVPHVRTKTFGQHRFSYCALTLIQPYWLTGCKTPSYCAQKQQNSFPSLHLSYLILQSLQNCVKNVPTQTLPQQVILNSFFLLPPTHPIYLPSLLVALLIKNDFPLEQ